MGFFGGRPGKDFQIKETFSNATKLEEDLKYKNSSPVDLGDIVLISYGVNQNEEEYKNNFEIDKEKYGKNFNSSFWQKIYIRSTSEFDNSNIIIFFDEENKIGLAYKFLFSPIGEKGEIGDSLNIIASLPLSGTAAQDTIELAVAEIVKAGYGEIAADELVSVTYNVTDEGIIKSYWYFKTKEGNWGRVLLTGDFSGVIENEFYEGTDVKNKVYSIEYINELLSWGTF